MQTESNQLQFAPSPLTGVVAVPPSKSDSHRALMAAALAACRFSGAQGSVDQLDHLDQMDQYDSASSNTVSNVVFSQDVKATLDAIAAFGVKFQCAHDSVTFFPSLLHSPHAPVDCNESGSTLRFMIPWSFLVSGQATFTGQNHLKVRPLTDYINLFDHHNLRYTYHGQLPLTLWGQPLTGHLALRGDVSSQYFSGLFMVLPLLGADSNIEVVGNLESRGYVDMTLETLKRHGVHIENCDYQNFLIKGNQGYQRQDYTVEGDYSNAAFWIVAGQIARGTQGIRLRGLSQTSLQRDRDVIDVVKAMGGTIYFDGDDLVSIPSQTQGTVIDASEIPDAIPVLSVLAALSKGTTTVINGQRLRVKESDRIKSTVSELSKLGANITETEDGMVIVGVEEFTGAVVSSWNDHRIAMATAVAATRANGPVTLLNPMAVRKSYPHFYSDYVALGGGVYE